MKRYEAVHLRYDDNNIRYGDGCEVEVVLASDYAALEAENAKLRAGQERRVPDAITMADVMRAWEYAEDHPHKYLRGTTNWCAAVAHSLNQQRVAAPSAPKADDPVKQMLLEALEKMLTPAVRPLSGNTLSMSPVKMVAHIEAAIAAARQEGKV